MGHRLAGNRRGLCRLPARREDDHARRVVQPFPAGEEAGARRRRALGGAPRHAEDHRRAQAPRRQKGRADGAAARPQAKGAGKIFLRRRARCRICPPAHHQVAGRDRLAAHRRSLQRRRFRRSSARHEARDDRARARQPGRARLCGRGRHHPHSLHRRHLDGAAAALRAAAVPFGAPRAARRRGGRRADPRDARGLRAPARSATRFLPGMKPVLVVGAGPVGLATALSLAHQGVPVQVIEAEPALTLDQRAGSYHPPTLEMLAPFGVTEAMHEIGIKVPRWQIRDRRKGVIVEWDLGLIADLTPYPYRFHLEQHRLTPILYEKLKAFPHAQVRFSTGFVDATQSGDAVTVKTTSGELTTPWLIGCDGGRSTVRKHLGTPFEGFTWPERFVVISTLADFAQHGFTSNAYVADPREWAAVFHMPGLWRLAFPVHPEENEADVLADEAVEARMQRFVSRPEPYDIPYASIYRVHQRVAKDWRVGRILLAGDAAHLNNPLGAFGLHGGLHDAILLAEYLGRGWRGEADASLLDLYVRQRRTANVEFVQTQSIGNKKMLEEADPAAREEAFAELRRVAADREAARDFLIKSSMIWSVRRAAEVA